MMDEYPLQLVDCGIDPSLGGMSALVADDVLSSAQASLVRRFDPGEVFGDGPGAATHMGFYFAKFVKS
jgi:hypothetical protein